ncbi:MAG: leucine-rich repeat domain-containing protein [Clostridia bacterium]|nr:leucine-rich repeat domain-containing protein [Clostridia bacterium]
MGKKILLTIAKIVVLTCLFAIGVSAENIGGIEYTLNSANKTATFAASNRTDCTLTRVVIPETVVGADGETYTVTTIADRSIGHQDAGEGNSYIEYLYIPKTVTYLGAQLVRNCYALKEVKIDASVSKLNAGDFWSCSSLEILDLSGMANLTTLDQITSSTPKLKTVKLPSTLTTIGGKAFQSCGGLTSIVLPSGLTTIGSNTFQSTKIQTLVLPATLNSVGGAAFHSMSAVQTLVFANTSFDGWSTNVTFNGVNPTTIFFAGKDPSTLTNHYTQWASYKTMSYADYLADPSAVTSKTIVYGTENCACGYIRTNEAPTFQFTSFTEQMTIAKTCAHCNSADVVKTIQPIFTCKGYSAPLTGNGGIAIGFTVNNEAISEYEEITGKTLNYGVFAVAQTKLGTSNIFDENGNAISSAITADLTSYAFTTFEVKVVGFTDEQKDSKLAMGAYVKTTDGEATEYSYLQATDKGAQGENSSYYFVSYNDIVAE